MKRLCNRAFCSVMVSTLTVLATLCLNVPSSAADTPSSVVAETSDSSEASQPPKRDLQAAMANLHQNGGARSELSPWPMVKGLALCLAAFCAFVFVLKKLPQSKVMSGKRMRVLERLSISSKSSLVLVEVDGKTKLLAVGPDNVTSIEHRERLRQSPIVPEFAKVLSDADARGQGVA